jgi:hypothetical protein
MPALASAQDKTVHLNIGGGPTIIEGELANRFKTGWGPAVGVTVDSKKKSLAFQFEYAYRWFDLHDSLSTAQGVTDASHRIHQFDVNLVANLTHPDNRIRGYAVGGPGAYYRKVEIAKYGGSGYVCDPYWYVCGTYPTYQLVGSRGGWDLGFNAGGGVAFKFGDGKTEFYMESRYHFAKGPDFTPPEGSTLKAGSTNGHYVPVTFGFRF